jgi:hypothetical protein
MNVYGVGVVENEADIIAESVAWALQFCRRLWIWDLGSVDGTDSIIRKMAGCRLDVISNDPVPYRSSLRGLIFELIRDQVAEGDWIYIFDADEFLEGDVPSALAQAEREGAGIVRAWQANFYPSRRDFQEMNEMGEAAWTARPLTERIRGYRVEWIERRFVRVSRDLVWNATGLRNSWHDREGRPYRDAQKMLIVRHYRYRSPRQVALRYETRQTSPVPGYGHFRYEGSGRFGDKVYPSWRLRYWRPGEQFRVPWWELVRAVSVMSLVKVLRHLERRIPRPVGGCV